MPQTEKHSPGSFSWIELGTSDQDVAKTFYTSMFGWAFEDSPTGPNNVYTMFKLQGRDAAAAYTLHGPEIEMHVPPHWNLYVSVESADDTAKKAGELGGQVLAGPFDVSTYGRMAVIRDPTGAVFCIWEPMAHSGIGIRDQHGSFCWADLSTADPQTAATFYAGLFGWELTPGQGDYLHIRNGEAFIGGVPPAHQRDPNAPPHWLIYIQVDDCKASTDEAKELGARIYMEPMTMQGVGTITVLADPQNAVFALYQPMPHASA